MKKFNQSSQLKISPQRKQSIKAVTHINRKPPGMISLENQKLLNQKILTDDEIRLNKMIQDSLHFNKRDFNIEQKNLYKILCPIKGKFLKGGQSMVSVLSYHLKKKNTLNLQLYRIGEKTALQQQYKFPIETDLYQDFIILPPMNYLISLCKQKSQSLQLNKCQHSQKSCFVGKLQFYPIKFNQNKDLLRTSIEKCCIQIPLKLPVHQYCFDLNQTQKFLNVHMNQFQLVQFFSNKINKQDPFFSSRIIYFISNHVKEINLCQSSNGPISNSIRQSSNTPIFIKNQQPQKSQVKQVQKPQAVKVYLAKKAILIKMKNLQLKSLIIQQGCFVQREILQTQVSTCFFKDFLYIADFNGKLIKFNQQNNPVIKTAHKTRIYQICQSSNLSENMIYTLSSHQLVMWEAFNMYPAKIINLQTQFNLMTIIPNFQGDQILIGNSCTIRWMQVKPKVKKYVQFKSSVIKQIKHSWLTQDNQLFFITSNKSIYNYDFVKNCLSLACNDIISIDFQQTIQFFYAEPNFYYLITLNSQQKQSKKLKQYRFRPYNFDYIDNDNNQPIIAKNFNFFKIANSLLIMALQDQHIQFYYVQSGQIIKTQVKVSFLKFDYVKGACLGTMSKKLYLSHNGIYRINSVILNRQDYDQIMVNQQGFQNLSTSSNQQILYCNDNNGNVLMVDLQFFKPIRLIQFFPKIKELNVLNDDYIVVTNANLVKVWNLKANFQLSCIETNVDIVHFSRDGNQLVILNKNSGTIIWESIVKKKRSQWSNQKHFTRYFSTYQTIILSTIIHRKTFLISRQVYFSNLIKFIFNLAVVKGKEVLVKQLLERGCINMIPDGIILTQPPIQYSIKACRDQITKLLINYQIDTGNYLKLMYQTNQQLMLKYISKFFYEAQDEFDKLAQYAEVQGQVQPILSTSAFCYNLHPGLIKMNIHSDNKKPVRFLSLKRSIQVTAGSDQLLQISKLYSQYSTETMLEDDAHIMMLYQWRNLKLKFYLLQITLILNFIFQTFIIIFNQLQTTIIGLILVFPLFIYQLMTLDKDYLKNASNIFDLLALLLLPVNYFISIFVGIQIPTLRYFTLLVLLFRLTFCMSIIPKIRHFVYIFKQITKKIMPFVIFLAVTTFYFVLAGMLCQNKQLDKNLNFSGMDSLQGIFYGQVQINFVQQLPFQYRFISYFHIFLRQLVMSIFLLNGILVGIVSNNYQQGQKQKELISYKAKIQAVQQVHLFQKSLFFMLGIIGVKPTKRYLHGLVTTIPKNQNQKRREQESSIQKRRKASSEKQSTLLKKYLKQEQVQNTIVQNWSNIIPSKIQPRIYQFSDQQLLVSR